MFKVQFFWSALILSMLVLAGCNGARVNEVTIGTIPWPGYAMLSLAEKKGFFEQEGVSVHIKKYKNVSLLHDDYLSGKLDGLTATLSELLLIRERSDLRPQVFLVADFSDGPDMILTKAGMLNVASMKGARVGVDIESLSLYVLARGLEKNGLSLKDVKLVDMDLDVMEQAMTKPAKDGGVDAVVAYPPVTSSIQKSLDVNKVFTSSEIPGEVLDVVALESALVQNNKGFVESIVRGYAHAVRHLREHPEETIGFLAEEDGMSVDEVRDLLAGLKVLDVCQQKELFLPSGTISEAVKTSDLVMRRVGLITGADQTVGMITFGPVQIAAQVCP